MKTKKLKENKGITLTALIVTIIVLIILAVISITSINGQRDTIEESQAVKVSAEVATYQEELDIIEIKTVTNQINEGLDDEEYVSVFKEMADADKTFDEAEKTIKYSGDEVYLRIITEEGYVFDIYPDEIIYRGLDGEFEDGEDLTDDDVTFACDPSDWTNESVLVTVKLNIDTDSTLQYSVDGSTWETYTSSGITVTTNGKVYVRLLNSDGLYGDSVDYNVENIDTLAPNSFTITVTEEDDESVTISGSTTDKSATSTSGSSGIAAYYFSCDGGKTWVPSGGTSDTSYTFEDLEAGTTYTFAMKAVDGAGNETIAYIDVKIESVPDLTDDIVEFTQDNYDWTNENVTVYVEITDEDIQEKIDDGEYILEYSTDGGETWEEYAPEEGITVDENTDIEIRLSDGTNSGDSITYEVDNIDKTNPTIAMSSEVEEGGTDILVFGETTVYDNESMPGIGIAYISEDNENWICLWFITGNGFGGDVPTSRN